MKALAYKRDTCGLCDSADVGLVVPLSPLPCGSPNTTHDNETPELAGKLVPLDLYMCRSCGHVQLLDIVNPEFQYQRYRYRTSISLGLTQHFSGLVRTVVDRAKLSTGDLAVEIGSNDGSVLRQLKALGIEVLGVDPAVSIARGATLSGVPTLPEFFNCALAREIRDRRGPAKVILANYVLANIDGLQGIAEGIKALLHSDGLFVVETQYGRDVFERTLLDTIYHEHIAYFNLRPLRRFFAAQGLEIVDVERIATKGGSIRLYVQHAGGPHTVAERLLELEAEESAAGFDRSDAYGLFKQRIERLREELDTALAALAPSGRVAGYGASVGTVTLLHYFGLAGRLEFIVDDDPVSPQLSGPGYAIDVLPRSALLERRPEAVVLMAWRYAESILRNNEAYRQEGGAFVVLLPALTIIGPGTAGRPE